VDYSRHLNIKFQAAAMESNAHSFSLTSLTDMIKDSDEEDLDLKYLFEDDEVFDMIIECIGSD
jgi:hypothetical protein